MSNLEEYVIAFNIMGVSVIIFLIFVILASVIEPKGIIKKIKITVSIVFIAALICVNSVIASKNKITIENNSCPTCGQCYKNE